MGQAELSGERLRPTVTGLGPAREHRQAEHQRGRRLQEDEAAVDAGEVAAAAAELTKQ